MSRDAVDDDDTVGGATGSCTVGYHGGDSGDALADRAPPWSCW